MRKVLLLALFLSAATVSFADPQVRISTSEYLVNGQTADEVRRDLDAKGYLDQGKRFDAHTSWHIAWHYNYDSNGSAYTMSSVQVTADIQFLLPRLNSSSNTPAKLTEKWSNYRAALELHEAEHKVHGVNCAYEVESAIQNLPSFSSPSELSKAVDQAANAVIHKYNQIDVDYDNLTGHGRKQGAVFP